MEHFAELGVGGIFALLVLREVFGFIKNRRPAADRIEKPLAELVKQVDDLHRWHNVNDDEGVKIWYVRKSLEDAIYKLGSTLDKQTELLRMITEEFKYYRKDLQNISEEVHDLKRNKK